MSHFKVSKILGLIILALTCALSTVIAPASSAKSYSQSELISMADNILRINANSWNLRPQQLTVNRVFQTNDGLTTIRYVQNINNVPVMNSFVSVTLTDDGEYISHVAAVSEVTHLSAPKPSFAIAKFLTQTSAAFQLKSQSLKSQLGSAKLLLADPELTDFKFSQPSLIWRVPMYVQGNPLAAKQLFLSAATGRVLRTQSLIHNLTKRPMPYVCDLQKTKPSSKFKRFVNSGRIGNLTRNYIGRTAEYPLCELSDPARLKIATSSAITSINETVEYFQNQIGVDISAEKYLGNIAPFANFGKDFNARTYCNRNPNSKYCVPTISGHTNVCAYDQYYKDVECPMENAFWVPWSSDQCHSGACSGMFFGRGFDKADDVVAHELAHGVTTSDAFLEGLCDSCEATAISEALSDFFGEAVDQLNAVRGEKPDANWGVGEDISGGPFRNLAMTGTSKVCRSNPAWSPIRQIDDLWDGTCDSHTNLGPADRFAWLISNGGIQNGITVTPIGTAPWDSKGNYQLCDKTGSNCTAITNMTRLAYRALPYLNGNSNYAAFGSALNQACKDLTKAKQKPFSLDYCFQVSAALAATGITPLKVTDVTRINAFSSLPQSITAKFGTPTSVGSGVSLRVQFKALGSSSWQTLTSSLTNNLGQATFTVTFPSTGSYRVATVASDSVGTYTSLPVNITQ